MAIIEGLPGIEVTIYTDGGTAKEYDDPSRIDEIHRRPQEVSKYIECKDNEPFRIHLSATKKYLWGYKDHALNFAALIDGIWAKGELCRQDDTEEEAWERDISYRVVKSPSEAARYVFQEFAFSTLIKADRTTDEQLGLDMERVARIGIIEVKVYRTIVQGDGPTFVPAGEHPNEFTVSREATRGRSQSHATKFTRTQPATKPNYVKCSNINEDNGPIAIFRLKYRSRAALRLEGITPEPHSARDWFVTIPDDKKDEVKEHNFGSNRNTANNSNEAKKETLKEEKHIVGYQLDATLKHSSARSVASSVDFGILSKRQPEKEASDSIRGNSSSGKRLLNKTGSQNNSPKCPLVINVDDDDDSAVEDVLLVGEACKPLTCHPINIFRLSAEREVSRKINTATKINPKSKVTITRDIGRTFVLIDADDNNGQRPTRRNANTGPSQRPITSHSAFQSTEATPQTKREQQFVINHDKGKLIDVEDHHRGMQRLQELRRDFYRIAEDVFKEVESHHRAGGVAAATSNPLSYLTKPSTSASILPTLQRSESNRDVTSNRATTADGLNSCKCPVLPLKGAGIHTAEGSTKLDPSLHRNKAERTESASSSSRCSPKPCLPVELDNGTGAGSEEGTAKAVKREFSETVNLAKGPIRLPRPFKMCKTHDGHEAIDLAGSE